MFKTLLGLTPVLFLTYLIRFEVLGLPTNLLEIYTGVLFIWWIIRIIQKKQGISLKEAKKHKPILIAVALFIAAVTLELVITLYRLPVEFMTVPLGIWKGWIMAPIAMFLMFITTFKTREDIHHLQKILIYTGGIYAFLTIIQFLTNIFPGPAATYDDRLVWPYFDPTSFEGTSANYPAMFLGPILVLAVFKLQKRKKIIVYSLAIAAMILAIIYTKSFAAWLSVIFTIAIGFFIQIRSIKKWWVPIIAGLIIIMVAISQAGTEKFQYALQVDGDSSTAERIRIYQVSLSMIQGDPLFGTGMGQFQRQFELQAPEVLDREVTRKEINHALHAHNIFLMLWLSFGILGLISFLYLSYLLLTRNPVDISVILIVPIIYFFVHGLFDVPYFKNDLAFEFWFFASLITIAKQLPLRIQTSVTKGMGIAKTLGFPTINLTLADGTPLPYGVYTASIETNDGKQVGVFGYGKRLTQGIEEETCEIHLFDNDTFPTGEAHLEINTRIRNWKKFKDMEQLTKAVEKDISKAKTYWNKA